jgi:hypothetical protein
MGENDDETTEGYSMQELASVSHTVAFVRWSILIALPVETSRASEGRRLQR